MCMFACECGHRGGRACVCVCVFACGCGHRIHKIDLYRIRGSIMLVEDMQVSPAVLNNQLPTPDSMLYVKVLC